MDNIEHYLDRVCRGLGGSASLRRHLRQELREHILEAAERYKATGLAPEEALQKAIADFGDPGPVHQGLEDVYGRDVMGILIEKAMQWKEKTMKAKWLWSSMASLFLLLAILAQTFFALCVPWFVTPTLKEMFKDMSEELPPYVIRFLKLADFLVYSYGWVWILALLLIPWAVFEWRYRGENKPLIRLSALALVSLATTALVWWSGIVAAVPPTYAYWALYKEQPERVALESARMADAAMARLDRAVKEQNLRDAGHVAMGVAGAFEYGYTRGSTAAGLATMTQLQRLDEIRNQLRLLTKLGEMVRSASLDQLPDLNQQMQQAYTRLKVLVGDWPKDPGSQPTTNPTSQAARETFAYP